MAEPSGESLADAAKHWRKVLSGENWYALRELNLLAMEQNQKRLGEYWDWVARHEWVLRLVPFVELVMVMNGMAHGMVKESSDIDLFVVARSGRVWTVRAVMLVLLTLLGLRARPGKSSKRFSPEFFVDTDFMDMEVIGSQSTYLTSFWVGDFTPIVYPQNFSRFWSANSWLKRFLPMVYKTPNQFDGAGKVKLTVTKVVEWILGGRLGDTIEKNCFAWQKKIIENNLEQVGVQPGTIIDESVVKILWPLNIRRAEAVEREIAEFLAGAN